MRIPTVPGNARVILPANASREEWLAMRAVGIGGSDISALLEISPYSTAFDVYRSKTHAGATKDLSDNPAIEWGHRLEEAVAQKAADELGLVARTGGGLWQSVDNPVAVVTPDRNATRRRSWKAVGPIECKSTGDGEGWEDGSAPLHYRAQLQWQMGILGFDRGWLACLELGPARNFYIVEETFDADWFGEMVTVAETFWSRYVLGDELPMHDLSHPRTADLLGEIHPKVVLPSVQLDADAQEWIDDFHAKQAALKKAEARFEEAKNFIRLAVGDAGAAYLGDRKVISYPEVSTSRVDVKSLRANHPDVAKEVTVTSTHRRLTVAKTSTK